MANPVNQLPKITPTEWNANSGQHYSKVTDAVNSLLGYNGTVSVVNHLSVNGNNVQNVANPVAGTDAVNLQTAETKYSPSVVGPQLDVGGSTPLKGLTNLYLERSKGLTVTIVTAKLTPGGTNGSMTFSRGRLVGAVAAT